MQMQMQMQDDDHHNHDHDDHERTRHNGGEEGNGQEEQKKPARAEVEGASPTPARGDCRPGKRRRPEMHAQEQELTRLRRKKQERLEMRGEMTTSASTLTLDSARRRSQQDTVY